MKILKYYKMLLMWKDVSEVYKEENEGQEKPFVISRRFLGVLFAFLGLAVSTFTTYVIPQELFDALTTNIVDIQNTFQVVFPLIMSLYGTLTAFVGIFKKKV
jgi:hypothetical protein